MNASQFLMLGGYDYCYLNQHIGHPDEPVHLPTRNRIPTALMAKYERILASMLAALDTSNLTDSE